MNKIITRFAPSPTGLLHIGNVRTALINFLFARKNKGEFILRVDDTDVQRNKQEYKDALDCDLDWLGIKWDKSFKQSERFDRYNEIKNQLIESGRLYACYETPEELAEKRKTQMQAGKPPKYDRASLNLSDEQIAIYEQEGRKPHYRFLIAEEEISWNDLIKGELKYHGRNIGDPVLVRADGTITYMLCSVIDDFDYGITHILRGEDHVSNTAVQIQLFEAVSKEAGCNLVPQFGHLSLIKAKEEKISKRVGGFEISALKSEGLQPMAVNSFLALVGTSSVLFAHKEMNDLIDNFDINSYGTSPTIFMKNELEILNQKLVISLEYTDILPYLGKNNLQQIDEKFWLAVRPNLKKLDDIKDWWQICTNPEKVDDLDTELLDCAAKMLPQNINEDTWEAWTKSIAAETGKKGKKLFMPLRLALTGKNSGPELKNLLPLLTRAKILSRLLQK